MNIEPVALDLTPWQRVVAKLGLSASALSAKLGRHRSKMSRVLKDEDGLISGRDQVLLLAVAKSLNVELTADDLMPAKR